MRLTYIALLCIRTVMKLEKELVAASSATLVLSVLAEGDSYGYAIIQRVRDLSDGKIEWTDGMLYPVLHWLEENGQIRGRWEKAESGRRRRYYSLASKGKTALRDHREQWETVSAALRQLWRKQYA
jgi:PadR family transcriptional regulator, regulatory protein PadR